MTPLHCPHCGNESRYRVVDTKLENDGWRRRECLDCGARWSTREINLPIRPDYVHRGKVRGQLGLGF